MIVYTMAGGYGKADLETARRVIDAMTHAADRATLRGLLYDYACLLRVIEGRGHCYRHEDGSEVRRVKLY